MAIWYQSRINLGLRLISARFPHGFFGAVLIARISGMSLSPPETSLAYFESLTAPSKKLVWFEESGQEPFVDEPARFNAAMLELVRPVVG